MNDSETGVTEKVRAFVARHGLLAEGEKVLAAVSGGADSVCLLYVLRELGYSVEVVHFDHQTRGGESAADAAFVRGLSEKLGVACHVESRPIAVEAGTSPHSFEEYARKARYDFFERVSVAHGIGVIATGHHADDQAETILMRLVRGATPHGLAGIPVVRAQGSLRIVRPLLDCTREEVLRFLVERGVEYRTDRTNADTDILRNKVRLELLPLLAREYNPRVKDALRRLGAIQRTEDDLLERLAAAFVRQCFLADGTIDRAAFREGHAALQHRALLKMAWQHGIHPDFDHITDLARFIRDGATGQSFDLGHGVLLRNGRDVTEVEEDCADVTSNTRLPREQPVCRCLSEASDVLSARPQVSQGLLNLEIASLRSQ